jgi:hypothetical protein
MRIRVNLASEPFRRDRPLILATIAVGAMLVVLLGVLSVLAISERQRSAETRAATEKIERQIRTMQTEQARLEAVLRQPKNAEVLDRNMFLNELLVRKGVSWTKLFSDLETITPHNVRLVQVRPQINPQNVTLDMVVAAQAQDPVISFLMQLESAAQFGRTTLQSCLPPSQSEPSYRCRVSVSYAQKL